MPELPEVETIRRSIIPHCEGQMIVGASVRRESLRWPIPAQLNHILLRLKIKQIQRRAKYLLFDCETGTLLLHLGMSGYLKLVSPDTVPAKHDHFELLLENGLCLRLNDSRRFGAVLWTTDPASHPLLKNLGPEPLGQEFTAEYLSNRAKNRQMPLKTFIMDSKVVVGVGNIYANEALFRARLHPNTPVGKIKPAAWRNLVDSIKLTLAQAIESGGTTLKDFRDSQGKPGYFQQVLMVYGQAGRPCCQCQTLLEEIRLGQRTTVFCPKCQSL
jgi:formamidopyrimidine-DNA glycosylase